MQRGHDTEPPSPEEPSRPPFFWVVLFSIDTDVVLDKGGSRVVAALIAALRTVVNGGLMPHARHGGKCVVVVAVAGSKLEGTGLEKEQIGQIQVALTGFGEDDCCGTTLWGRGEDG